MPIRRIPGSRSCFALSLLLICVSPILYAQARPAPVRVSTTRQAPDEFGTQNYTVTTIGSASLAPTSDDSAYTNHYNGWPMGRFPIKTSDSTHFVGTVSIPAGAVIDFIGLETDSDEADGAEIELYLVDRYNNITPIAGFQSTQHNFASDYNSSAIGFQLMRNVHNQLIVDVDINGQHATLAWVEIWWKRTVSPAPASPTFSDVPTTDEGYQYIEALYASGITGGCGAGNFCPDANLTRRQMAIFLAKALGLHWPY